MSQPVKGWGVQPTGGVQQELPLQVQQPAAAEHNNQQPVVLPQAPPVVEQPVVPQPQQPQPEQAPVAAAPPTQPATPQPEATAATPPPTIQSLLREFAAKPGCDKYSGDREKINLLAEYLWLRNLTPTLPFETFLELFAAFADFDDENCKHPADAIKTYLPRSKKQASESQRQQWAAKDVVDYVALYVDMIREAERTHQPVPLSLNDFLQNTTLISQFQDGAFAEPAAAKKKSPRASKGKSGKAEKVKPSPTAAGQRCIYNAPGNRQYRGAVLNYYPAGEGTPAYADFEADSGEQFQGLGIHLLELCDDPPPEMRSQSGDELPRLGNVSITIGKAQFVSVKQALNSPAPLGTVALGDTLYSFSANYVTGPVAQVAVVNGEPRPYVDATLRDAETDEVLCDSVAPRENIDGNYRFLLDGVGYYELNVKGNE